MTIQKTRQRPSPADVFQEVAEVLMGISHVFGQHGIEVSQVDLGWKEHEGYGNGDRQVFELLPGSHGFALALGHLIPRGQDLHAPLVMEAACRLIDMRNPNRAALTLVKRTGSSAWGLRPHKLFTRQDPLLLEIATKHRLQRGVPFAFITGRQSKAVLRRFARLYLKGN